MTSYTTEAICLKAFDYSESSKILSFYSPERGLIRAIAKGAKRPKSKLAGACELLNRSELQLIDKSNLDILCQYQSLESFHNIRLDVIKLAFAVLFAELVCTLATEHDGDCEAIYALLKNTLSTLAHSEASFNIANSSTGSSVNSPDFSLNTSLQMRFGEQLPVVLATDFHLRLLAIAGYAPVMDRCMVSDQPLDWTHRYYPFSAELGGIVLETLDPGESGERVNVSTATLRALNEPLGSQWDKANPIKVLKFLRYYTSYKLERRIKAYDFVFQLLS